MNAGTITALSTGIGALIASITGVLRSLSNTRILLKHIAHCKAERTEPTNVKLQP